MKLPRLGRRPPPAEPAMVISLTGACPICERETLMQSPHPWLRDHFHCTVCGSAPRERALLRTLELFFPTWRDLSIHEGSPALAASAKLKRECAAYVESQYDPSTPFGTAHPEHGWRSENLESQTFVDASFDLVITQDVFEHLMRPDLAIAEIARTLKPGGAHVCTVPIGNKNRPSAPRARDQPHGTVIHLAEPVYHGNPIDPASGSLVTMDYGYDIAAYLDAHSGLSTTIVWIDDLSRGIRAEFIEVLVSRKDAVPDLS